MRPRLAGILSLGCGVLLFLSVLAVSSKGAALADAGIPGPAQAGGASSATCAPAAAAGSAGCQITSTFSTWWQYWEGIRIKPIGDDTSSDDQWTMTWQITTTQPGWVITATVNTWRCPGWQDYFLGHPDQTHCGPQTATYTTTQIVTVTMPISRVTTFSVTSPTGCCELDETDLVSVNGNSDWGSSYFLRWARAPVCPIPPTPTVTPTATPTPTATETATPTTTATNTPAATETATDTPAATATATDTPAATDTPTEMSSATATATATATDTPAATETASPTASATGTVTWLPIDTRTATLTPANTATATPTGSSTPTHTPTPAATRTGFYFYFPLMFKDYGTVF